MGVKLDKSRAHNNASNGGAERCVRTLKEILRKEKISKITLELLQKLTFKANNHIQDAKKGSPAEHFLRIKPKACYLTQWTSLCWKRERKKKQR